MFEEKERRILDSFHDPICPFCGQEMEEDWDEYEQYFYCNCKDAKKLKNIEKKIFMLECSKPRPKFRIIQLDAVLENTKVNLTEED